jgi:hypothetical protein
MYAPRSESTNMLSSANEDENKYNPTSPEDNEKRADEKKLKDEYEKEKANDIKHLKIKPSQGLGQGPTLPTDPGLDDGNKRDDEREIGLQGGPAGSRGHLLDMATGAKTGTGSSLRTGEPMDDAWSSLLKMTEDESLWWHSPEQTLERAREKKRKKGYNSGKMYGNVHEDIPYEAKAKGQTQMDLGIPAWLRYAHYNNPDLMEARMRLHPYEQAQLRYNAKEWDRINSMSDLASNINMDKHNLYNQQRVANQMIPQNFMESETPDTAYEPSPIPGMVYLNGQLITDPRIKNTGEPMADAWSELLKNDDLERYLREQEERENAMEPMPVYQQMTNDILLQLWTEHQDENALDELTERQNEEVNNELGEGADETDEGMELANDNVVQEDMFGPAIPYADQIKYASEPMADAWSDLLKTDTPGKMEGRRRREKRREFRPSTGQFKRPPGGQTPVGATMRRFRAHMRGIKGGKKTGLMKPHLSVEMSHRGIATKQPMSKDPKRYRQYMGQQEARKILGNVRTTYSPHARHSARSFTAGPTGGGRLTGLLPGQSGQMAQPALRPMRRPRMPRMRQPRMPGLSPPPQMGPPMSSVPSMPSMAPPPPPPPPQMMMSDERTNSDLLKSNRHANRTEMLALMRMLIQAQRVKDKMKKAGTAFEEGAVPAHPAGVQQHEDEDEKNDGPTQNLETNSSRLGLDPAGYLSSKRGHMG